MAITTPGPRLGASIPLSFVRTAKSGRKRVDAAIALIPFIDLLLTVVVFLLMSFSTTGDILQVDVPEASNGRQLALAPIVSVDTSTVMVDGHRVADTNALMARADLERVEGLVTNLRTARENWEILHPREPFPGRVIVQVDRDVDFRALRKVLFSVGQAGYGDVDLAVRAR